MLDASKAAPGERLGVICWQQVLVGPAKFLHCVDLLKDWSEFSMAFEWLGPNTLETA